MAYFFANFVSVHRWHYEVGNYSLGFALDYHRHRRLRLVADYRIESVAQCYREVACPLGVVVDEENFAQVFVGSRVGRLFLLDVDEMFCGCVLRGVLIVAVCIFVDEEVGECKFKLHAVFRVGCADGAVVSLHNHFGEVHADAGAFVEVVVGGLIITFKHLVEFTGGYAAARIFYFYDYKLRLLLVFLFDCDIDEPSVGRKFECV